MTDRKGSRALENTLYSNGFESIKGTYLVNREAMAVINRTEFLKRIRWIQGTVFLIVLCGVAGTTVDPQRCKNVEAEFRNRGFATAAFPNGTSYGECLLFYFIDYPCINRLLQVIK